MRVLDQPRRGHRARDQARLRGAARIERTSGEDEVECRRNTDQPRQARGAAEAGEDPEQHFGQSDLGVRLLARDPRIAREREFGATAQTHAVDRGHRRRAQRREPGEHRMSAAHDRDHLGGIGDRADRVDIGARDE